MALDPGIDGWAGLAVRGLLLQGLVRTMPAIVPGISGQGYPDDTAIGWGDNIFSACDFGAHSRRDPSSGPKPTATGDGRE